MRKRVNFFDEIGKNKRNSVIILIIGVLLYIALAFIVGYAFNLPNICSTFLAIAILLYAFWLYNSGAESAMLQNAIKIEKKDNPFLWNTVEGLALAAGIPMPEIYIIKEEAPNAFAIGKDPARAKVAFTEGLLKILNREELEGVVAHEISHIANYDVKTNLTMIAIVGAAAILGDVALRSFSYRRRRSDGEAIILVAIILSVVVNIVLTMLKYALSREREYLADANGAKLTRYPLGLAKALEKIKKHQKTMKSALKTAAHLYFVNPFPFDIGDLFSTHPPINKRIERLKSM